MTKINSFIVTVMACVLLAMFPPLMFLTAIVYAYLYETCHWTFLNASLTAWGFVATIIWLADLLLGEYPPIKDEINA